MRLSLSLTWATLTLALTGVHGATIIAPSSVGAGEGSANVSGPFNSTPATIQFIIDVSQLSLSIGDEIISIAFRQDNTDPSINAPAAGFSFSNWDLVLSSSLNAPGSLSSTYASNLAGDAVGVRSGSLAVGAGDFPGGASPNTFAPAIIFTTPFVYTGANGGHLLFTLTHDGAASYIQTDAHGGAGIGAIVVSSGYQDLTGTVVANVTPVVLLGINPVPEPGTAIAGLLAVALLAKFRRR